MQESIIGVGKVKPLSYIMKKRLLVLFILIALMLFIFFNLSACKNNDDEATLFTVSFETNGGTLIKNIKGNVIEEFPVTEKEGYFLEGWYTDPDFTSSQVVFPFEVLKNTVLYARWFTAAQGSPFLQYELNDDNTYSVTGYTGLSKIVVIPQSKDDKNVTRIAEGAFATSYTVKEIHIPDSVEIIERAFYRCPNLENIFVSSHNAYFLSENGILYDKDKTALISYPPAKEGDSFDIPQTVATVKNSAIRFCANLKQINIPASVTSINNYFEGCHKLERIAVHEQNQNYASLDGVLFNKDLTILYRFPQNHHLTEYAIPDGVLQIAEYAFSQSALRKVALSSSVKDIALFEECYELEEINVHSQNLFFSSVQGVLFDKTTERLLQYPQARKGNQKSQQEAYYEYTLPLGVKIIAANAFNECRYLNKVILPSSLIIIEDYAFNNYYGNFNLYEVEFEKGSLLKSMGDYAFNDCPLKSLTLTAVIPPEIGEGALNGVDSDFIIYAPSNALEFYLSSSWNAFNKTLHGGAPATSYTVKFHTNGGTKISDFNGVYIKNEIIPSKSGYVFGGWYFDDSFEGQRAAFPMFLNSDLNLYAKWHIISEGTQGLIYSLLPSGSSYAVSGYEGDAETVIVPATYKGKLVTAIAANAFASKTYIKEIVIPQTVTEIGSYAFSGSFDAIMRLENVVFEQTKLNKIGDYAFQYCFLLKNIELPRTLQSIGNGAFNNCLSLEEIFIPQNVSYIGAYAFTNCGSLKKIDTDTSNPYFSSQNGVLYDKDGKTLIKYPAAKNDTHYSINAQTEYIVSEAFYGAKNLVEVILPDGLSNIDSRAFYYCEKLKSVYIPSSMRAFNSAVFRYTPIETIVLSWGVEVIEDNFNYLDNLSNIEVENGNNIYKSVDGVLFSSDLSRLIRFPMGRPGEYTVPQSVRTIGEGAFNGCKLSKIVFNDNLRKIASEAFYGCNGLISVSFPEDLEIIEDAAFMHASNLRSVHINSLTAFPAISEDSFALAGGDLSVYAPDNLIERLEADEKWNKLRIVNATHIIDGLELLLMQDGDEEWYRLIKALNEDKQTEITIPDTVNDREIRIIGSHAFDSVVRKIILPSTIRTVKNYAFSSGMDNQLTTIVFEEGNLEVIEQNAFSDCLRLTNLVLKMDTPPYINENALSTLKDYLKIYVKDIQAFSQTPFGLCELRNVADIVGDFAVSQTDGGVVIKGYLGKEKEVVFPSAIADKSVIAIDKNAIDPMTEKIIIESGIEQIKEKAFSHDIYNKSIFPVDMSLKEIIIQGQNLTSIGAYAFEGAAITEIQLPSSLQTIESLAFKDCRYLQRIDIDGDNQYFSSVEGVLYDKDITQLLIYPMGKPEIEYALAQSACSIGAYAFDGAANLLRVNLNNDLIEINEYAFSNCVNLLELSLPQGLLRIKAFAFKNCHRLYSLTIPAQLKDFASTAIVDCSSMKLIYADTNSDYIAEQGALFDKDKKTLISYPAAKNQPYTIPDSVIEIAPYAFYGCSLSQITIPSDVQTIGEYAFAGSKTLTSLTISAQITELPNGMIKDCDKIEELNIPAGVTIIGNNFAQGCRRLRNIQFPATLKAIGEYAFANCLFTAITLNDGLEYLGKEAFADCISLTQISLPMSLSETGETPFKGMYSLYRVSMGIRIRLHEFFENGVLPSSLSYIELKEGASRVPKSFFMGYQKIKHVVLPSTIDTICEEAFSGCTALETVEIKGRDGNGKIEANVFADCYSLTNLIIRRQQPFEINQNAFNAIPSGLKIYVPVHSVQDYEDEWRMFESKIFPIDETS